MKKPFGKDIPKDALRISLCDTNADVVECWQWVFREEDTVEVCEGSLLDAGADALLSPANSFGDMSGGVDKAIDDAFGGVAQTGAMEAIRREYFGELPVGAALVVPLPPRQGFRYLICAPTMRTPGSVQGTINAYLAMRGALVAVLKHNRNADATPIRHLAIPGLCTGVGGMDYGTAAEQMHAAYQNVLGGKWEAVVHPVMAPYAFHREEKTR